jgi:putative transposase
MIPDIRGRCSIRLRGWDYASPGLYFVTLCVQNRECLFGEIANGEMDLTDAGMMIEITWLEIPQKYPGVILDEFVIMPNHVHGIIGLYVGAGPRAYPSGPMEIFDPKSTGRTRGSAPTKNRLSLPDIIRSFKTLTMRKYSEGISQSHWSEFQAALVPGLSLLLFAFKTY